MRMIVVGASTGGLEPIEAVLARLPASIDAAVLIVRHTLPGAPAVLDQVLRRDCALPVRMAADGLAIEPGHVYVAPPGHHATMVRDRADGAPRFALRTVEPGERGTPSVDLSIVSAAQQFGERCIAVVLSGHLDDGTAGARHLARHSGTTIVQSPDEATAPSMPLNVLHRDSPSFVLEGRDIADVLVELAGETVPAWLSGAAGERVGAAI